MKLKGIIIYFSATSHVILTVGERKFVFLYGWIYSKLPFSLTKGYIHINIYVIIISSITTWEADAVFPPKFLQIGHESNYLFSLLNVLECTGQTKEYKTFFFII